MKQFIFRRKLKKLKRSHDKDKKFVNYNDMRSVLIIYESDMNENNPKIKAISKSLQSDGKKVTMCGFVNKKKADILISEHAYMIDSSHVSFFGEPNTNFIKGLLNTKFDVVLDLTLTEVLPLQYVLAYSKSPFKVGRKISNLDLLDFMIDLKNESEVKPADVNYLFDLIIFYLKSIESHN